MAEELLISQGSKEEKYSLLLRQIQALTSNEQDTIALMANISAMIKDTFGFLWVGFYRVVPSPKGEEELVLGPFQGPLACTRIRKGKGVCGCAWAEKQTLVVKDVNLFAGHIACSSLSKSEIVVPIILDNQVVAVLDIDSQELSTFDEVDKDFLEKICSLIPFNPWHK